MTLGNLLLVAVLGVVIYLILKRSGICCGGHDHMARKGPGGSGSGRGAEQAQPATGSATAGTGTDKDPVCGMKVHDHEIASSYRGRTFYFCSEQCRKLFDLNPNRYAGSLWNNYNSRSLPGESG